MTALLPIRVSIYDFLMADANPIAPIVADTGNISIPQAKILIENAIQAIISALLAFNQAQGGEAVLKKLFNRTQVKELRKHNAFNLNMMATATQLGQPISNTLFHNNQTQREVYQRLASLAQLPTKTAELLLASLGIICVRELAILSDFAQLDGEEIETWFNQQAQFLALPRTTNTEVDDSNLSNQSSIDDNVPSASIPKFDDIWHEITGYQPSTKHLQNNQGSIPHYAKVIGRTASNSSNNPPAIDGATAVVDVNNSNDILTFSTMENISLPYQRWLLQLAKIADIYLSRYRLKIAPEPKQVPSRPLVSFGFIDEITKSTASEIPIEYDEPTSFWKTPLAIIMISIIGGLLLLAIGKYQYKKHTYTQDELKESEVVSSPVPNDFPARDIAIVTVDDENSESDVDVEESEE